MKKKRPSKGSRSYETDLELFSVDGGGHPGHGVGRVYAAVVIMFLLKAWCRKSGYPALFVKDDHGIPVNYVDFGYVADDSSVVTNIAFAARFPGRAAAEALKQSFDGGDWFAEVCEDKPWPWPSSQIAAMEQHHQQLKLL